MTFGQSIKTVFTKYVEFTGVASRSEFWWWTLLTFSISAVLQVVLEIVRVVVETDIDSLSPDMLIVTVVFVIVALVWSLGVLLPTLAVSVRRLRDAGYHWAWIFIQLVPLVGWIVLLVLCAQPSVVRVPTTPAPTPTDQPTPPPIA